MLIIYIYKDRSMNISTNNNNNSNNDASLTLSSSIEGYFCFMAQKKSRKKKRVVLQSILSYLKKDASTII